MKYKTLSKYFEVQEGVYDVLVRNVQKGVNTMLIGPTGVGKTELVSAVAKATKRPLTILDMGTMTDPISSLVGTHIVGTEKGVSKSKFVPSRFSQIIQKPGIILLDEISRAAPASNNLLFPVMDFRKELPMEYSFEDATPIKVHPDCVFFSTANLGSEYTGTQRIDRALMDRFMIINVEPLDKQRTIKVISKASPLLSKAQVALVVDSFFKIDQLHKEFKITFNLSLRHLKQIAALVEDGFSVYDSFYLLSKGLGNKDDTAAINAVLSAPTDGSKLEEVNV